MRVDGLFASASKADVIGVSPGHPNGVVLRCGLGADDRGVRLLRRAATGLFADGKARGAGSCLVIVLVALLALGGGGGGRGGGVGAGAGAGGNGCSGTRATIEVQHFFSEMFLNLGN